MNTGKLVMRLDTAVGSVELRVCPADMGALRVWLTRFENAAEALLEPSAPPEPPIFSGAVDKGSESSLPP